MSRIDNIIISILDQEVPESYTEVINSQISLDPNLQNYLQKHRYIKKMIQDDNASNSDQYYSSSQSLKTAVLSSIRQRHSLQTWRWIIQLIPAVSAILFAFALVIVVSNRFFSVATPNPPITSTEYTEYQILDFVPSIENGHQSVTDPSDFASVSSPSESIDLQINISDMEQLFYLLEKTRSINGSINSLTIQLPEINTFQILGESQLRPLVEDY